jgi:hypothetical protein
LSIATECKVSEIARVRVTEENIPADTAFLTLSTISFDCSRYSSSSSLRFLF